MLSTLTRGSNRRAAVIRRLGPGSQVLFQDELWEVWALNGEGGTTLLRIGEQKKPNFVRAEAWEVELV
jgi:hypothetical protein